MMKIFMPGPFLLIWIFTILFRNRRKIWFQGINCFAFSCFFISSTLEDMLSSFLISIEFDLAISYAACPISASASSNFPLSFAASPRKMANCIDSSVLVPVASISGFNPFISPLNMSIDQPH